MPVLRERPAPARTSSWTSPKPAPPPPANSPPAPAPRKYRRQEPPAGEICFPKLSATETALVNSICSCSLKSWLSTYSGSAGTHHAGRQHHDILLVGAGSRQRPLQSVGVIRIAHRNQHAAGAHLQRLAPDRVLLFELEMLLHLLLRQLMLARHCGARRWRRQ